MFFKRTLVLLIVLTVGFSFDSAAAESGGISGSPTAVRQDIGKSRADSRPQPATIPHKKNFTRRYTLIEGDTVPIYSIPPVYVFRRPKDMRRYARLVRNVKAVYPYAKQAHAYLHQMEDSLARIPDKAAQRRYIRSMEEMIVKTYTPILRRMSFSQGKILIKLIDRETSRTSYELLREFRGGFIAGFWQGVARIFSADLKAGYDKDGEDQLIEQIITLYEAGLL